MVDILFLYLLYCCYKFTLQQAILIFSIVYNGKKEKESVKSFQDEEAEEASQSESENENEEEEEGEVVSSDEEDPHSDNGSDSEEDGPENQGNAKNVPRSSLKASKSVVDPQPSVSKAMKDATKKASKPKPDSKKSGKKRSHEEAKSSKKKDEREVQHPKVDAEDAKPPAAAEKRKKKGEAVMFTEDDVTFNLYRASPQNLVFTKVQLSKNLMLTCRMIEQEGRGGQPSYEYPALIFQRKTADNKCYENSYAMSMCPTIMEGLKIIMKENKSFFQSEPTSLS